MVKETRAGLLESKSTGGGAWAAAAAFFLCENVLDAFAVGLWRSIEGRPVNREWKADLIACVEAGRKV